MKFTKAFQIVRNEAVFESSLFLRGEVHSSDVRRQLSRRIKSGYLLQLRWGLYACGYLRYPSGHLRPEVLTHFIKVTKRD